MEAAGVPIPGGAPAQAGAAGAVVARERVAALVRRYFAASTIFLLAAGALGLLMRQSQADLLRVGDNFFYAAMTAHGLGAFVAWAGFAVMGFGLWVLVSSGFELRPAGYLMAEVTWWTMVVGTVGIVVTTLLFGFGGSWVFLYPLPFHAAGNWSDATAGVFAGSVLLAGVAILAWCGAVLHTVTGPSLPAARPGFWNRLGVAMGLGYLSRRRFPTTGPVPYTVLPLTAIGIDMIIATVPLALLLVEMIVQSAAPSVTVDPLLAKNVLWWFGHPVVYLLLFPAVSIYYMLVPRYAKRPLVGGRIVAAAWLLAVVVNVIIWAHHVYIDYPDASIQDVINVAMQPLTFSISIVSALSIYSLCATVWRSEFEWAPAAKFLAFGIFGWFTAGLSGMVNATIRLDVDVHNTLWIVGHFHHMALLNIGLVVFAAAYAFVPELTGRRWYSRRLADWHLWLTIVGGYGAVVLWLSQGLTGAPRRWAVLPDHYDPQTVASLPFVALMAMGQLVFAWNAIQTWRGRERANDDATLIRDEWQLALGFAVVVLAAAPLIAAGARRGHEEKKPAVAASPGQALFKQSCGGCHTLSAAQASGTVGPDLDKLKPDAKRVLAAIARGGRGSGKMPKGLLSGAKAKQVADFVSKSAGKPARP